ncbi:probable aspartic proteinase GIP2 [Amaranthus tricolor]|uniref:probable aspartic proteinase GIP2 n=1 Tax=Amaranthus tricolor TaxID=29722 RepID=UPI0025847F87|nr:probable aspartic proteinase GIP2 [Amaranthus tricolor]
MTFISFFHHLLLISSLLFTLTSSTPSFRPKALVLQVSKDPSTLQYTTTLTQRTPPISVPLTIHLGAQFLWVDCDKNYVSSTYRPARCNSAQCSLANSHSCSTCNAPARPGCNNNTCGLFPENPFISTSTSGELAMDLIRVSSTDGSFSGPAVSIPNFIFNCAPTSLLKGLPKRVQGIAGFGRSKISVPSQFSSAFSFVKRFYLCLSSSPNGVAFFGYGPDELVPGSGVTFSFTPLLINPVSTAGSSFAGEKSAEYFIGVRSIKINQKEVPINKNLLSINKQGIGGTKISTVDPYTVLESSIYKAVAEVFMNELGNVSKVKAVAPFKVCYDSSSISSSRLGYEVPTIDLVLQNEDVYWSISGANSMVQVNDGVICLGFVDGGVKPRTTIVIGGYQLEDNYLRFDLASSRLGFSSSLLHFRTTCSNFNFGS